MESLIIWDHTSLGFFGWYVVGVVAFGVYLGASVTLHVTQEALFIYEESSHVTVARYYVEASKAAREARKGCVL